MFAEPEFWVAVGFVILMGVFAYLGVHRTVITALDKRSERIKAELDDARRLKDEAAKLLAEYKARHASAEREAQDILTSAILSELYQSRVDVLRVHGRIVIVGAPDDIRTDAHHGTYDDSALHR